MVGDLTQAKNRLFAFLLRHGRVWRDGDMWTLKHRRWLAAQRFDDPALSTTFAYYRAAVETREAAIDGVEADLQLWFERGPVRLAGRPSRRLPRVHPSRRVGDGR